MSEFRLCFTLCLFIILLVQFGLLSGHLLGNSCPLGKQFVLIVFCLFGFKGGIRLLIAPVSVHCFSITFVIQYIRAIHDYMFLTLYSSDNSASPYTCDQEDANFQPCKLLLYPSSHVLYPGCSILTGRSVRNKICR